MENARYHLESLPRTMRSDGKDKCDRQFLAPLFVKHYAWSLAKFAIGADGETACFGELLPNPSQTKMEPRWEADGVFLGKLDLSDEVIVGTPKLIETTRSVRRMTEKSLVESKDYAYVFWSTMEPAWHLHWRTWRSRKRYITRALVHTHGATDGCPACQDDGQIHVPKCREDIFDQ